MTEKFAHLHLHSQYSLLDGFCNIKKLVKKVKSMGMDAVAVTDHGAMFGAIELYKACEKEGIKPILGCEIYMSERGMTQKESSYDWNNYHLVLLAENEEGYQNLMKIVSLAYIDGFYRKPRADFDLLRKYSSGIIALTGCIAGKVPQKIIRDDLEGAKADLSELIDIFGKDNLFVEIQDHGIEDEKKANEFLVRLAKDAGVGLVATNDAHYIEREEAEYHDVLLCVQTASSYDDPKRMKFPNDEFYIKSKEEMEQLFSYAPEAIANTGKIADRCNVTIKFRESKLPRYDLPEGTDAAVYLRDLCMQGLKRKYPEITDELMDRLNEELEVIAWMGFNHYFLIVWDFIKYAKDNGIAVGPGRGSAAGSLVSYALDITDIDPIRYQLIFERFLNRERVTMPDIDIDFCYENRHKVIEYVIDKYKETNVAQIITFGTLGAKAVIRDVGRSLGMSYGDCDRVAKAIPSRLGTTIESAIEENPELVKMIEVDDDIKRLIDISKALEGTPRHTSTHAAGVVITDQPVMNYVPLYVNDGNVATQFSMTTVEELGLLKMDFLGLRNLTVINHTIDNVKHSKNIDVVMNTMDLDDPKVYELISRGDTLGVFQLESAGMRAFMQNLKPDMFEDIIAGISLYRPGPMQYIDTYVKNKRSPQDIKYLHHSLEPILNVTYGCMVYQEQVMQIVRDLAGYSMGQSDNVRRAMSKKKEDVMKAERQTFVYGDESQGVMGCVNNGIDEAAANQIYDQMMDFASYAFNKSHAAAYAVISYQTAYLKAYYPAEFMAALLTSITGFDDKLTNYIHHLKDMDIQLLSPDINHSFSRFAVEDESIRFGLLAVKGLGENAVDEIITTRESKGAFEDFSDFVKKMDFRCLNKRGVESLIKSGAFDSMGHKRSELLAIFSDYIDGILRQRKQNIEGQMSMMDLMDVAVSDVEFLLPKNLKELDMEELLLFEKESMGLYVSGHPLEKYEDVLNHVISHDSITLNSTDDDSYLEDGDSVVVGGIIVGVKTIMTKKNQPMAFLQIEDLLGSYEVIVFSRLYEKKISLIKKDNIVWIKGRVSRKEEESVSIQANSMYDLTDEKTVAAARNKSNQKQKNDQQKKTDHNTRKIKEESETICPTMQKIPNNALVVITMDERTTPMLPMLKDVMHTYPGKTRIVLYDKAKDKKYLADESLWVTDENIVLEKLRNVIGFENVKIVIRNTASNV